MLTGAGRAFSAGVDLKALGQRRLDNGMVGDLLDVPARDLIVQLTTMPQPVIARVNGACFTGALELVLACDLAVAADGAKFGDTHAKFGLRPTWGMSQRLVAAVGITRARDLSYTVADVHRRRRRSLGVDHRLGAARRPRRARRCVGGDRRRQQRRQPHRLQGPVSASRSIAA